MDCIFVVQCEIEEDVGTVPSSGDILRYFANRQAVCSTCRWPVGCMTTGLVPRQAMEFD